MPETTREEALGQDIPVLSYAPPAPRTSKRDLCFGILISIFLSFGVGMLTFGLVTMAGFREEQAGPFAVGLGFIVLAVSLAGTVVWLRRFPR